LKLVDTSGLYCYYNRDDPQHNVATGVMNKRERKLINSDVLAEFTALAEARGMPRPSALGFAGDLLDAPDISVIWVDESLHRSALDFLQNRLDKTYSLCDAVSFVLMRSHGINEALTTDRHFVQEGFTKLLD